ncbi:hypothetical protein TNCV_3782271 [Trichonephila clavipes]|nr:hypothetical protein TNCV_3782271 [Trichonephila clavipes]
MTPELATPSPNYHTIEWEDVSALDRFNLHRCITRWVFISTELELVTSAHGRKLLSSALECDVHLTIGGNKLALPHSFDVSSSAKKFDTFYKHRVGRYATNLWIVRRKFRSSKIFFQERNLQRDASNYRLFTYFR